MRTLKESLLDPDFNGPEMINYKFKGSAELFNILKKFEWTIESNKRTDSPLYETEANDAYNELVGWMEKYGSKTASHTDYPVWISKGSWRSISFYYELNPQTGPTALHTRLWIAPISHPKKLTRIQSQENSSMPIQDGPLGWKPACYVNKDAAYLILFYLEGKAIKKQ